MTDVVIQDWRRAKIRATAGASLCLAVSVTNDLLSDNCLQCR